MMKMIDLQETDIFRFNQQITMDVVMKSHGFWWQRKKMNAEVLVMNPIDMAEMMKGEGVGNPFKFYEPSGNKTVREMIIEPCIMFPRYQIAFSRKNKIHNNASN